MYTVDVTDKTYNQLMASRIGKGIIRGFAEDTSFYPVSSVPFDAEGLCRLGRRALEALHLAEKRSYGFGDRDGLELAAGAFVAGEFPQVPMWREEGLKNRIITNGKLVVSQRVTDVEDRLYVDDDRKIVLPTDCWPELLATVFSYARAVFPNKDWTSFVSEHAIIPKNIKPSIEHLLDGTLRFSDLSRAQALVAKPLPLRPRKTISIGNYHPYREGDRLHFAVKEDIFPDMAGYTNWVSFSSPVPLVLACLAAYPRDGREINDVLLFSRRSRQLL